MKRVLLALCLMLTLLLPALNARADTSSTDESERETISGGAWQPGPLVPCTTGIVTAVHSRLDESSPPGHPAFNSGVVVEMRLPAKPKFLNGKSFADATVVHYDHELGNALMKSETPGTRVQVCLVSFPTPTHDPDTGKTICDPNVDPRGLTYRVYDYRRHGAFVGPDSQHGCGGA